MNRHPSKFAVLLLLGIPVFSVLHTSGCGARSELWAPQGYGGSDPGCTETTSAAFSAAFGGGIHHVFTECLPRPDGGPCPSNEDAIDLLVPVNCGPIESVECGPIVKPDQCCYDVLEICALT